MTNQHGSSLIETVTVVAIIALVSTLAIPSLSHQREHHQVHRQLREIQSALALARTHAIIQGQFTTMESAGPNWQVTSSAGTVLWQSHLPHLRWRGFSGPPLRFTPEGFATNGSFWVCYGQALKPRGVIVSSAGRVRQTRDDDGDGRHERSNGQPFECSP